MNFTFKRSAFISLVHGFRPGSLEGYHTSRILHERNYYDVLNLKRDCSAKEIREAFIELAKKFHPDTNSNDPRSHARFVELQKAYSVLSAPAKRQVYDSSTSGGSTIIYDSRNFRKRQDATADFKDYEQNFSAEYREFYYKSRQETDPNPPASVGGLRITIYLLAFTTVGALLQYLILRQDDGQNVPKPCHVTYPEPHSDRPSFMRWIYRRNYREEMEKHVKGIAAFEALKHEMDRQAQEYDVNKLRAAYFKEVNGIIGLHLVPKIIRPELPSIPQDKRSQTSALPSKQMNASDKAPEVKESSSTS